MTRFRFLVLTGAACALLPPATAAPKVHSVSKASPTRYQATCGMIYSATEAKKDHYVCPMDHKKMVPIRPAAKARKP